MPREILLDAESKSLILQRRVQLHLLTVELLKKKDLTPSNRQELLNIQKQLQTQSPESLVSGKTRARIKIGGKTVEKANALESYAFILQNIHDAEKLRTPKMNSEQSKIFKRSSEILAKHSQLAKTKLSVYQSLTPRERDKIIRKQTKLLDKISALLSSEFINDNQRKILMDVQTKLKRQSPESLVRGSSLVKISVGNESVEKNNLLDAVIYVVFKLEQMQQTLQAQKAATQSVSSTPTSHISSTALMQTTLQHASNPSPSNSEYARIPIFTKSDDYGVIPTLPDYDRIPIFKDSRSSDMPTQSVDSANYSTVLDQDTLEIRHLLTELIANSQFTPAQSQAASSQLNAITGSLLELTKQNPSNEIISEIKNDIRSTQAGNNVSELLDSIMQKISDAKVEMSPSMRR